MLRLAAGALLAVAAAIGLVTLLGTGGRSAHARHVRRAAPSRRRVTVVRIGASARGRPIDAVHVGSGGPAPPPLGGCGPRKEPGRLTGTRVVRPPGAGGAVDAWVLGDPHPPRPGGR